MKANRTNSKTLFIILQSFVAAVCVGDDSAASQPHGPANSTNNAWAAPARAARKENPVPADAKSIAEGKELFTAGCAACHGATGRGDGSAASTLERNGVPIRPGNLTDPKLRGQTDGALFWKISQGNTPMPAWGESLSEEQRWAAVNYVRTLSTQAASNSPVLVAQQPKKKTTKPPDYE